MLWNYKCLSNPKFNWMRIFVEKDWLCSFTLSHYCVFKGDWQQLFILYGFRLSTCSVTPPGSLVQGILQARMLEWFAISSSRVSSWPRDPTQVAAPALTGWFFTTEPLVGTWKELEALLPAISSHSQAPPAGATAWGGCWGWGGSSTPTAHSWHFLVKGKFCT